MIWDVHYTNSANLDLHGIYDYIADVLLEPGIAERQTDRIMDAADSLEHMPFRHHLQPHISDGGNDDGRGGGGCATGSSPAEAFVNSHTFSKSLPQRPFLSSVNPSPVSLYTYGLPARSY